MTETKHEERRWWRTFDEALQRLALARADFHTELCAEREHREEALRRIGEALAERDGARDAHAHAEQEIVELQGELAEGAAGRVRSDLDKAIAELEAGDATIAELRTRCATLEGRIDRSDELRAEAAIERGHRDESLRQLAAANEEHRRIMRTIAEALECNEPPIAAARITREALTRVTGERDACAMSLGAERATTAALRAEVQSRVDERDRAIAEAAKWKAEAQLWASKVRASEADLAESQATWRDAAAKLTSMVRALEAEAADANARLRGAARDLLAQMGLVLGSDAELIITIKRKDLSHADR